MGGKAIDGRRKTEGCTLTEITPESPDTIQIRTSCWDSYMALKQ